MTCILNIPLPLSDQRFGLGIGFLFTGTIYLLGAAFTYFPDGRSRLSSVSYGAQSPDDSSTHLGSAATWA